MNALNIAFKDLQILLKDRAGVIYLFVLPLVFIVVLSTALGGLMDGDRDSLVTLPIVNLDGDGQAAQSLVAGLDQAGGVRTQPFEQVEALRLLEDSELSHVLIIPVDFSAQVDAGGPAVLQLVTHPDASSTTTASTLRVINGVAQNMDLKTQLVASFEQIEAMLAKAPPEYREIFSTEKAIVQADSQFERSKTDPLVNVKQTLPQSLAEQTDEPSAVEQNVPGYTVIFVFLSAQATAFSIFLEKRQGSFRRLLAAPISKTALLTGKMIPNFVWALIQIAVIFAVSIFLLPLLGLERMTLGKDPFALVLVSLVLALASTGLGILIAAIARSEAQIGGVATLLLWTMGAVGGALFPPFLLGGLLDLFGKLVPHYWAVRAYQDLIVRGRALPDVAPELLALSLFAALFFVIGLWRFEFE